MNLLTLPLVNPRHHLGKLKGFAYLPFKAFMWAYFDAYMKLLYHLCLVRLSKGLISFAFLGTLENQRKISS